MYEISDPDTRMKYVRLIGVLDDVERDHFKEMMKKGT